MMLLAAGGGEVEDVTTEGAAEMEATGFEAAYLAAGGHVDDLPRPDAAAAAATPPRGLEQVITDPSHAANV